MSYLVLARKYRPQTFEELVGQQHVTVTLANALEAKRLAHAYIFSGPRGCGKTTSARILAMALNCVNGPTAKPCGKCPQCADIASGASSDDVLEIDGASNRGIDQIRELRDTVKYSPARSRYRIYIIDEAHQITEAGFNALLKTLEEPPAHAVFMMATTEMQKIPATILSRCQRFQLRPIPPAQIQQKLTEIMKSEKLKIDGEVLMDVARAAHGSLRDALSLLDQLIAYSPTGVTGEHVRTLLGLLPRTLVKQFAETLLSRDSAAVLKAIQRAVEDGFDLFQLGNDLKDYWHQILLWKSGVKDDSLANEEDVNRAAKKYELADLERILQVLSRGLEQMRRSDSPRITFELTALELSQEAVSVDELLDRLELLEKSLRSGTVTSFSAAAHAAPTPSARPAPTASATIGFTAAPSPAPAASLPPMMRVAPPESSGPRPLAQEEVRAAWPAIVKEAGQRKPVLEGFLVNARLEIQGDNTIAILCGQEFYAQSIIPHLPFLSDILKTRIPEKNFLLKCVVSKNVPAPMKPHSASAPALSENTEAGMTADLIDEEAPMIDRGDDEESEAPAKTARASAEPDETGFLGKESLDERSPDFDPSFKKILGKFPGKLKKIETDE